MERIFDHCDISRVINYCLLRILYCSSCFHFLHTSLIACIFSFNKNLYFFLLWRFYFFIFRIRCTTFSNISFLVLKRKFAKSERCFAFRENGKSDVRFNPIVLAEFESVLYHKVVFESATDVHYAQEVEKLHSHQ
jgi:hypothetical protein